MILPWLGFLVIIFAILALDLGVFHKKSHTVSIKEALIWSAVWVSIGLSFAILIYFGYEYHMFGLGAHVDLIDGQINDGSRAAIKYLTAYILEKSLSADNIFVIAMIFSFMTIPSQYQHRVLYWGILGALFMRGVMIGIGSELIARYHFILYFFGIFLIFTAIKMIIADDEPDPHQNRLIKWSKKILPISDELNGEKFFVFKNVRGHRKLFLTRLALTLMIVEVTDLVFAVDSIPAVFSITADPFIVFTSNIFAILGLRSLYFALAGMMTSFHLLKYALSIILMIVGLKMLFLKPLKEILGEHFDLYLLVIVLSLLGASVLGSTLISKESFEGKLGTWFPILDKKKRKKRKKSSNESTPNGSSSH